MKNLLYILVIGLLFCCTRKKVQKNISTSDSISKVLNIAQNSTDETSLRIKNNAIAFDLLISQPNDSLNRANLNKVANQFRILKKNKEFDKVLNAIMSRSLDAKDSISIAKSYHLKGVKCLEYAVNDSAFYYFLKSEKLFLKLKDSLNLGKNYIDKAFVQMYESDYSGCEFSAIQALAYLRNFKIRQSEYDAYNMIGISSNELKNFDNAIIYHTKALNVVKQYGLDSKYHFEANSRNNIGVVYQYQNKHKEAIESFKKALTEKNLLKDAPSLYAMIMDNLAYSKFKLKDYSELPTLFYKALKIRVYSNNYSGIIINKIHLSEFYAVKRDTINAKKYANEALQLARQTKISGDILVTLKQLSIVEHENSSKYSKEYIRISDSLQQEERKAKDKFARIAFETDEIILQKDKLAEQNRSLLYFFVGTLLIGLLLFIIRAQRAKNRELVLREAQQKANEEIYSLMISQQATIEESRVKEKKRIAQELHDGVLGRLFGARLNLDSLNRFTDEESVESRFNYLAELKNIEQDIREISHDLNREKYVLINNFRAIVNNLLEQQQSSYSPNLTVSIDENIKWESVRNTIKINLYRILQESLQNINKYANADNINIEFRKEAEDIILNIFDDGIGFDVSGKKKGIGLQNMQSRVSECEGTFEVNSKKGTGTSIIIGVPIEKD